MMNNNSVKYGITLIELLITVSLISLLLVTSLVSFDGIINAQNTQSAVQQVSYAVKKSKYYAKAHGVPTKISFPTNSRTYYIEADGTELTNNSNFDSTSGELPENMKIISNSCNDLYFQPDGNILDAYDYPLSDECKITVGSNSQTGISLVIQPGTGNVIYD